MNLDLQQLVAAPQVASGMLADGNPVIVPLSDSAGVRVAVWVSPMAGMGDGISVFYSQDDGITYTLWPMGECKTARADVIISTVTHLKFQRTSGSGHQSRWGIVENSLTQDVIAGPWLSQGIYP